MCPQSLTNPVHGFPNPKFILLTGYEKLIKNYIFYNSLFIRKTITLISFTTHTSKTDCQESINVGFRLFIKMAMSVENYCSRNIVWCKSRIHVCNCIDEISIFL